MDQRVTPALLKYIESNVQYPFMTDVSEYEKLQKIGQGTFGEVTKARHRKTGVIYALKKILMENEKEGFPITALREIKMLQKLKHPNITELVEICSNKCDSRGNQFNRGRSSFFVVFTFCEHDLAGLLSNKSVVITLPEIKNLMKQLFEGLHKIHASNVLHRDMKAANVLLTQDGVLKLADFGLARPLVMTGNPLYTNRVVTLWYRPPELLLGDRNYGPAIDIWGAGCIMAEMWTRAPIMQGDTEQKQLTLISQLCGSITPLVWQSVEQLPLFSRMELPQNFKRQIQRRLGEYMKDSESIKFIEKLLTLDPSKRPTADNAIDESFFWSDPMPSKDLRQMFTHIKGSMFEYTTSRNRRLHQQQAPAQHRQNTQQLHHTSRDQYVERTY